MAFLHRLSLFLGDSDKRIFYLYIYFYLYLRLFPTWLQLLEIRVDSRACRFLILLQPLLMFYLLMIFYSLQKHQDVRLAICYKLSGTTLQRLVNALISLSLIFTLAGWRLLLWSKRFCNFFIHKKFANVINILAYRYFWINLNNKLCIRLRIAFILKLKLESRNFYLRLAELLWFSQSLRLFRLILCLFFDILKSYVQSWMNFGQYIMGRR